MVVLYSIEGKKMVIQNIPAFSRTGSLSMENFKSNIYILELINDNSHQVTRVAFLK
jgi:hypothetical protein